MVRGIVMRHMSSNLVLLVGFLALALPLFAASSQTLAQEPEATPPNNLAQPADPSPLRPLPKPRNSRKVQSAAEEKRAETATAEAAKSPAAGRTATAAAPAEEVSPEIKQFCSNNVASAGQARVAWEAAKLKELEAKLRQRVAELEAKRAEYEEWLRKREEAMKKAEENIVAIYAKMRPDAAALQMAAMDDAMAAALLTKLKPSVASAILNEMDPGRAAHLTGAMVGSGSSVDGKKT
jgi:flagellar motility protein MotE (MotC chaperone)